MGSRISAQLQIALPQIARPDRFVLALAYCYPLHVNELGREPCGCCSIRFRTYGVAVANCAACQQKASQLSRHINPQASFRTPNPLPAPSEVLRASARPVPAYDWRTEVQTCAVGYCVPLRSSCTPFSFT